MVVTQLYKRKQMQTVLLDVYIVKLIPAMVRLFLKTHKIFAAGLMGFKYICS